MIMIQIRHWLIELIAGDMPVVMNVAANAGIRIKPEVEGLLISGCWFDGDFERIKGEKVVIAPFDETGANMNTQPVVWQGEPLPPLSPGQVWGMRIYPGGRRIVRPCEPGSLLTPDSAVKRLRAGHMVEVWLDDAVMTLTLWQQEA